MYSHFAFIISSTLSGKASITFLLFWLWPQFDFCAVEILTEFKGCFEDFNSFNTFIQKLIQTLSSVSHYYLVGLFSKT